MCLFYINMNMKTVFLSSDTAHSCVYVFPCQLGSYDDEDQVVWTKAPEQLFYHSNICKHGKLKEAENVRVCVFMSLPEDDIIYLSVDSRLYFWGHVEEKLIRIKKWNCERLCEPPAAGQMLLSNNNTITFIIMNIMRIIGQTGFNEDKPTVSNMRREIWTFEVRLSNQNFRLKTTSCLSEKLLSSFKSNEVTLTARCWTTHSWVQIQVRTSQPITAEFHHVSSWHQNCFFPSFLSCDMLDDTFLL